MAHTNTKSVPGAKAAEQLMSWSHLQGAAECGQAPAHHLPAPVTVMIIAFRFQPET